VVNYGGIYMSAEMLRKAGLFGIGVISLTYEKLDEFTSEAIKRGDMSREEGEKLIRDARSKREKQLRDIEDKISKKVMETLERSGISTKSDIEELKRKIDELEITINTRTSTSTDK
jgi:polyhydroxyalkanoate synthesis regulator phasin